MRIFLLIILVIIQLLCFKLWGANEKEAPDFAQQIINETSKLNEQYKSLVNDNIKINKAIKNNALSIDSLRTQLINQEEQLNKLSESLNIKIDDTQKSTKKTINEYRITLSKRTLFMLIALIGLIILILTIAYLTLRRLKSNKSQIDQEIIKTRKALEEEGVNLDSKLVEIIDKQLYVLQNSKINHSKNEDEIDHSLALKVADEIIRIQMNLAHMDPDIKGHKQLSRAVTAILDNFNAYGYEIPDLLNKPYNEGMILSATMVPDENLEKGTQIIKRIVKPQVNYRGKMIQSAQVVVAYND